MSLCAAPTSSDRRRPGSADPSHAAGSRPEKRNPLFGWRSTSAPAVAASSGCTRTAPATGYCPTTARFCFALTSCISSHGEQAGSGRWRTAASVVRHATPDRCTQKGESPHFPVDKIKGRAIIAPCSCGSSNQSPSGCVASARSTGSRWTPAAYAP